MSDWRRCDTHPDVVGERMWGCPDCLFFAQRDNAALRAKLAAAEEALRWIADPIAALQREAKAAGCVLNGPMALRLAESAEYLSSRAAAALRALEER